MYETVGLSPDSEVADIGAGTGIFSKLLLERGSRISAVEPNQAMREEAEKELGRAPNFRTISGAAEATGLPEQSVDFIVCAQSFHWFDRLAAQEEFRRILKRGGKAVLLWNSRLTSGTPFLEGYDELLRTYGVDYEKVGHKNIGFETLQSFFKEGALQRAVFMNQQLFDFEGLRGRSLSSSYVPMPGHPNYELLMNELKKLFDRTQQNGKVSLE